MLKKEHQVLVKAARSYARAVRAQSELEGSEAETRRALEELKKAALGLEVPTMTPDQPFPQ